MLHAEPASGARRQKPPRSDDGRKPSALAHAARTRTSPIPPGLSRGGRPPSPAYQTIEPESGLASRWFPHARVTRNRPISNHARAVPFYMAGPSAPTSVRTWSSPLHTMRSAFRGRPACSIPPSASCSALWSRRLRCHSARYPSSPMCCACALRPFGRSCATALTDRKHQGAVAAVREVRSLTHADAAAWVGRGK